MAYLKKAQDRKQEILDKISFGTIILECRPKKGKEDRTKLVTRDDWTRGFFVLNKKKIMDICTKDIYSMDFLFKRNKFVGGFDVKNKNIFKKMFNLTFLDKIFGKDKKVIQKAKKVSVTNFLEILIRKENKGLKDFAFIHKNFKRIF